jgi:transcriptional regulator with XRE-family HTH domain
MTFRYEEIGQRLKAFRMGSGLGADEIARKIGISRTALYRFERGELAKIDTLAKFAELLGVSTATLLGVGIEYIPSAVSYFERMRQIEETAEQIVILSGPISFLLASDDFQATLQVLTENITKAVANPARALSDIPLIMEILAQRKELYRKRRPAIVNLMSAFELERFLDHGFVGRKGMPDEVLRKRKALARAEIEHFARLLERQPIGVQIGIVPDTLPHTGFQIFRQPGRTLLAMSPFRLGGEPNVRVGVAMITSAADGVSLHEAAIQEMWNRALKGERAAHFLHRLLENEGKPFDSELLPLPDDGSEARPKPVH